MDDPNLDGCRILLAEDEHMIAKSLARMLQFWGATIVGPAPTLAKALAFAESRDRIDAAIIDINLRGEMAFPLADALLARGTLLIFTTGYEPVALPEGYRRIPVLEKPYHPRELASLLEPLTAKGDAL
jgi:DNA-binding response OmpR family regulator